MIKNISIRLFFGLVCALTVISWPNITKAAKLSLDPASKNVSVGDSFSVNIRLDSEGVTVDGVDVHYLKFDKDKLEAIGSNIIAGALFAATMINTVDNNRGLIDFAQIAQTGSTYTGSGVLATISFKAKAEGSASVSFDYSANATTDSNVSSNGRDILNGVTNGLVSISKVGAASSISASPAASQTASAVTLANTSQNTASSSVADSSTSSSSSASASSSLKSLRSLVSTGSPTLIISILLTLLVILLVIFLKLGKYRFNNLFLFINKKKFSNLAIIAVILVILILAIWRMNRIGVLNILGDDSSEIVSANLDSVIQIKLDQSAVINREDLKITLAKFEDSRCPSNVTCVWEGIANLNFNVSKKDYNLGQIALTSYQLTPDDKVWADAKNIAKLGNYSFMLISLSPNPSTSYAKIKISRIKPTALKKINYLISMEGKNNNEAEFKTMIFDLDSKEFADWFTAKSDKEGSANIVFNNYLLRAKIYLKAKNYLSVAESKDLVDLKMYLSQPQKDTQDVSIKALNLLTGDLNNDDTINSLDFSILNRGWGTAIKIADLNEDEIINSLDFSFINKNWGKTGEGLKDGINL